MSEGVNTAEADDLFELQATENDGRGVSCVRTICTELAHGDIEGVKAVVNNEWDKIRNYPTIVSWLVAHQYADSSWF